MAYRYARHLGPFASLTALQRGCSNHSRNAIHLVKSQWKTSEVFKRYYCNKEKELLHSWAGTLSAHGNLNLISNIDTDIITVDVHDEASRNTCQVSLQSQDNHISAHEVKQCGGLHFHTNEEEVKLQVCLPSHLQRKVGMKLSVRLPPAVSVTVAMNGSRKLLIDSFESQLILVTQKGGSTTLNKIKSSTVKYRGSGDVLSNASILGELDVCTSGDGAINLKKIQGGQHRVTTESGNVTLGSVYSTSTRIATASGNVKIGSCHGNLHIRGASSHIDVGACEGGHIHLATQTGNIKATLNAVAAASICSDSGDVSLNLGSSFKSDVINVDSGSVEVASEVNATGMVTINRHEDGLPDSSVNVSTPCGTCWIQRSSWHDNIMKDVNNHVEGEGTKM